MHPVNTTVALDPGIKQKALFRARRDQLSISAVIRIFLLDYAEGRLAIRSQAVRTENGFTLEEEAEILQSVEEAQKGKNISGPFETMADIRKHLRRKK